MRASPSEAAEIEGFRNVLKTLLDVFAGLEIVEETKHSVGTSTSAQRQVDRASEKRPAILPPSPEPKQKRKKSYGTM